MKFFKRIYILFIKFRLKYFERFAKKDDFNKILEASGFNIGKGTIFYSPNTMCIDRQRPWMLEIGKYCKITRGTVILTHDYSRSVLRYKYKEIIGEAAKTIIGDNVFIGINSIILMGTKIGNNVIVGAGSVVSGNIPDNVVICGNPAKIIMTLDDFYKKKKAKEIGAAKEYFSCFVKKYGRRPKPNEVGPFFTLFAKRDMNYIKKYKIPFVFNGDDMDDVIISFLNSKPLFSSFEEFESEMEKNEQS